MRKVAWCIPNASFDTKKFNSAVFIEIRNPKVKIRLLREGKVHIYGCRSKEQGVKAAKLLAKSLTRLYGKLILPHKIEARNINASASVGYKLNLEAIKD